MQTSKASENGLLKIRAAVTKMSKDKGWQLRSCRWLEGASKVIDQNWQSSSSYPEGISEGSWKRYRYGREPISIETFRAFSQFLGLDPEEIAEPLFNFYGFTRPAEVRNIFNDFLGDRVVHELWADPLAIKHGGTVDSYIKVSVASDDRQYLKILFVRQGWGTNVTIRPMNDAPVNASSFRYFKFQIRSPKKDRVGVRVRVVDANNICWGYGRDALVYESKNLSTSSENWSENIIISLDTDNWFPFPYDGFIPIQRGRKPNFYLVQMVTFEVGFEAEYTQCGLTRFSQIIDREGEIHITPVIFE